MSSIAYVRIFQGADGQFYYRTMAGNHQTLSTSEGYSRHQDAVRAVEDAYPGVAIMDPPDEAA